MLELAKSLTQKLQQGISNIETVEILRELLRCFHVSPAQFSGTWHPYGFLVIKLYAAEELGTTLRLHIWPKAARARQVPDWPVHNHPWLLHSRILCGTITNLTYAVEENNSNSFCRLYTVRYADNLSILEATDIKVSCEIASNERYVFGQDYIVTSKQYHVTNVQENIFASTIVLATNSTNKLPNVVGEFGYEQTYFFERRICEPHDLKPLIEQLESNLKYN